MEVSARSTALRLQTADNFWYSLLPTHFIMHGFPMFLHWLDGVLSSSTYGPQEQSYCTCDVHVTRRMCGGFCCVSKLHVIILVVHRWILEVSAILICRSKWER